MTRPKVHYSVFVNIEPDRVGKTASEGQRDGQSDVSEPYDRNHFFHFGSRVVGEARHDRPVLIHLAVEPWRQSERDPMIVTGRSSQRYFCSAGA